MSTLFIIFLLTLQSFGASQQNSYSHAVSKIRFNHVSHSKIQLKNGMELNVSYYGFSKNRAEQTIKTISHASEIIHENFSGDLALGDCKQIKLNVYDVKRSILNNRKIMTFAQWSNWGNLNVSALYETGYSRIGEPAMFISASNKDDPHGLNREDRARTLVHETVHYWQDRACKLHKTNSEADAYRFEIFFMASL
jgi:hypothetical protein